MYRRLCGIIPSYFSGQARDPHPGTTTLLQAETNE
jgi:hypothetical protein